MYHFIYDINTMDNYFIFAQFMNHFALVAIEVEILHYVIEINELAKRFEYLNFSLAFSNKFEYNEGLLMKMWLDEKIEVSFIDLKTLMKIYNELHYAVDSVVSCYGLTVIEIVKPCFYLFEGIVKNKIP